MIESRDNLGFTVEIITDVSLSIGFQHLYRNHRFLLFPNQMRRSRLEDSPKSALANIPHVANIVARVLQILQLWIVAPIQILPEQRVFWQPIGIEYRILVVGESLSVLVAPVSKTDDEHYTDCSCCCHADQNDHEGHFRVFHLKFGNISSYSFFLASLWIVVIWGWAWLDFVFWIKDKNK